MEAQKEPNNSLLDTTDCLEAASVFRGWKNVLFILVFLCLLVLQVAFWLVNADVVAMETEPVETAAIVEAPTPAPEPTPAPTPAIGIIRGPNEVTVDTEPNAARDVEVIIEAATDDSDSPAVAPARKPLEALTFDRLAWVIRITNAVLVLSATAYFLTVLFCLKLSLVARLGGISHISRAFFLSLIMLVLLLPWQALFADVAIGAIFTADELRAWSDVDTSNTTRLVLYFLRFVGFWLLTFLLLISTQIRTSRWARGILRRLEVI